VTQQSRRNPSSSQITIPSLHFLDRTNISEASLFSRAVVPILTSAGRMTGAERRLCPPAGADTILPMNWQDRIITWSKHSAGSKRLCANARRLASDSVEVAAGRAPATSKSERSD
jgi:hypothetical protein